jgi:hypothetical protein
MPTVVNVCVEVVEHDQALDDAADHEADTRKVDLPAHCGEPSNSVAEGFLDVRRC